MTKSLVEPKRVIAKRLALQLLGALNIRLNPKLHAGAAGIAADGDDRRSFEDRRDHRVTRAQRRMNAAAHQRLNRVAPELM